jgi:FkbM family methyltransferase
MTFYDYAKTIISERLKGRDTLKKVVENIKIASAKGGVAFYPCGVHTRAIIKEILAQAPEISSRIIGCFDKSDEANMGWGIDAYNIKSLDKFKGRISLLVVASNTFYDRELRDIKRLTNYGGPILQTTHFDIIPEDIETKEIISKIEEVYHLLADEKSKITYLITWLSKMLNDESLTYLFESEQEIDISETNIKYRNYVLEGLDNTCKKELLSELYKMKFVSPEEGDVVFDIGAYKGDTAAFFAAHVGKKGKVYSFEPVKSNYDCLVENVRKNNIGDIVIPVRKGCCDKSGLLKLVSAKSGAPWSFLSEDEEGEEVEVTSLDEFVETNNISKLDFIKIDVEGQEYNVILGAQETIKRLTPKFVIPLYHNTSDLFTIPLLMNKIGKYKLYVRCKIEGPFGINLYCIRK